MSRSRVTLSLGFFLEKTFIKNDFFDKTAQETHMSRSRNAPIKLEQYARMTLKTERTWMTGCKIEQTMTLQNEQTGMMDVIVTTRLALRL